MRGPSRGDDEPLYPPNHPNHEDLKMILADREIAQGEKELFAELKRLLRVEDAQEKI
jgi:hypothetical protein